MDVKPESFSHGQRVNGMLVRLEIAVSSYIFGRFDGIVPCKDICVDRRRPNTPS
jgi:hypothetical protein